jgi:hypothetical protein
MAAHAIPAVLPNDGEESSLGISTMIDVTPGAHSIPDDAPGEFMSNAEALVSTEPEVTPGANLMFDDASGEFISNPDTLVSTNPDVPSALPMVNDVTDDALAEAIASPAEDVLEKRDATNEDETQDGDAPLTTAISSPPNPFVLIDEDATSTPPETPPKYFVVLPTSHPFTPSLQANFPFPATFQPISAQSSPHLNISSLQLNFTASPSPSNMRPLVSYPSPVTSVERHDSTGEVSMEMSVDDEDDVEV